MAYSNRAIAMPRSQCMTWLYRVVAVKELKDLLRHSASAVVAQAGAGQTSKLSPEVLQYHKKLDCQILQAVSYAWSCLPLACLTCRVCLKDTLHFLHHTQDISSPMHQTS